MRLLPPLISALLAMFMLLASAQQASVPANGLVPDPATALRIAEAVLVGAYGEGMLSKQRPLRVHLGGEVWQVDGTPPIKGSFDGSIHVEISQRDGRIALFPYGRNDPGAL
jgi:hypothetical protein